MDDDMQRLLAIQALLVHIKKSIINVNYFHQIHCILDLLELLNKVWGLEGCLHFYSLLEYRCTKLLSANKIKSIFLANRQ
jgi:hypothetical protein